VQQWDAFVSKHPDGSVFQTPGMVDFYNSVENHEPVVIAVLEEKCIVGILVALIQKENLGYVTARAIVYGGPLIDLHINNRTDVLTGLLKELINIVKHKSIYIQFRNFIDRSDDKDIFCQHGFKFIEWLNYKVQINSAQEIKRRISKSKLRQIKKGLDSGAKITVPENIEQLKEFYAILKNLYKDKVKKPIPSGSFFENFYKKTLQNKLGVIRLVVYDKKVIGGIVIPVTKNKTAFEWYVCGLDEEYKHQYPSVIATWAALEYALENNLKTFDFMGAGSPDKSYGVREFKSKFGSEQVNFGRFERINNKLVYGLVKTGLKLFSPMLTVFR